MDLSFLKKIEQVFVLSILFCLRFRADYLLSFPQKIKDISSDIMFRLLTTLQIAPPQLRVTRKVAILSSSPLSYPVTE